MGPRNLEQTGRVGLGSRQAGDEIDHLGALFGGDAPGPRQAGDLGEPRPVEIGDHLAADRNRARLDPAVNFVDRRGGAQIRVRRGPRRAQTTPAQRQRQ
jgi:hypothetical protein